MSDPSSSSFAGERIKERSRGMATLFALVYSDVQTAEEAAETAKGLEQAGFLKILDSSLVTKNEEGKIDHHGERHTVRGGAIGGAVIGGLTGAIFLVPILGIAAGTAVGAYIGKLRKSGASDDFHTFREQVSNDLQPGGAALLLLGQTDAPDRVVHDLGRHGGTLRSTDISDQQIAELQAEIDRVSAS
jgi:uncharacterized membrane protein